MYSSINPSVTVIPPSPVMNNGEAGPDSYEYRPSSFNGSERKIEGLPHSSTGGSDESAADRPPVPVKPVPAAPVVRPPTPKTKERTPRSSPQIHTADLPPVRHQPSNKSLKSHQPPEHKTPTPLPSHSAHMRSATSPPAPSFRPAEDEEPPITDTMTESPTALRPTEFPQTSFSPGSSPRRDTDVLSITSQGQKKKPTGRPWRRSAPKKPMGLAGAIAASGLAMANPGMTAPHQSQLSPQVMNVGESKSSPSLVTSPMPNRKLTASPEAISPTHRRHHTATNRRPTHENGGADRRQHQRRRTTGSTLSHGEEEEQGEYYSGLDESSNDGSGSSSGEESGSDLEDLDIGEDDIPVTGFAVASNKRNADFHELFPGIPEGDYLIEDYGCALQREILIQGRMYVSENHICFHANIFGWVTDLSIPIYEITTLEKRMTAFVIPNAIRVGTPRADYTFASFLSRDTTFDVIHNIWRLARPGDAASIGSGSMEAAGAGAHIAEGTIIGGFAAGGAAAVAQRKATTCACGREGQHFPEVPMNTIVPGTPDRIYNLMFASGFMKDFMALNQKLFDIQVSDWAPTKPGSKLLARNMSYIKPLNASLGPKQTKCEIRDETVHLDFDDFVSTLTTTRNPDVPSGGVFSVKTRTCIMWASPLSTKIIVSTQVEWTGRSFIKGIIERSAIEGQKQYHADLEKAMRAYIQEHQSEFMPEGVDLAQVVAEPAADVVVVPVAGDAPKLREVERSGRGLQWAWDTFDGASNVARQSTRGALELIHDQWEGSTWKSVFWTITIVTLLISNALTFRMNYKVDGGRRPEKEPPKVEDKEKWVAGVVTALWDEFAAGKFPVAPSATSVAAAAVTPIAPPPVVRGPPTVENLKLELSALQSTLEKVEERVRLLRQNLGEVQSLNNID